MSRHRPLHGADSAEAWDPRPFRVKVKDEEGPAWWVTVNAIGPNDAREQGRQKAYDQGAGAARCHRHRGGGGMKRIQRQRTKGWRMPKGAVYVGRPSQWGNPFPVDGDVAPWLAVALGEHADAAGRRAAAVIAYRAWMTGEPMPIPTRPPEGGEFEYSDGSVRIVRDIAVGMGLMMLSKSPIRVPARPNLEPLRGHDLACYCALDQPCHADVLLELTAPLADRGRMTDEPTYREAS